MLQSNWARSLVVNLHSKLQVGGIGEFFSIGEKMNQKDPLCYNANICNRIISKVSQLGVELGEGGSKSPGNFSLTYENNGKD